MFLHVFSFVLHILVENLLSTMMPMRRLGVLNGLLDVLNGLLNVLDRLLNMLDRLSLELLLLRHLLKLLLRYLLELLLPLELLLLRWRRGRRVVLLPSRLLVVLGVHPGRIAMLA